MLSVDTNILLYAADARSPWGAVARAWLESIADDNSVFISELVLAELYVQLRTPASVASALSAPQAVAFIQAFRQHPVWHVAGFSTGCERDIHDRVWQDAARDGFPRGRIYDIRIARSLQAHGVSHFATANVKDFQGIGFVHVWNPLLPQEQNTR